MRAAIRQDVSALTSVAVAAKLVAVTVSSKLKCISYQMCMFRVKFVMANATTQKRWKFTTKVRILTDILEMTVEDAVEFFKHIPKIHRKLQTIVDVGLGYVTMGQPATTLSGGEAQRMKLASELHKNSNGKNFYILDEPTTGLHTDDIARLLKVLERFVDAGNTVLVIEHNLDVIKSADYVIDLGPEGGDGGGTVLATGTPEEIAEVPESYTGHYLKRVLKK